MLKGINIALYIFVVFLSMMLLGHKYPHVSNAYNIDEMYFMLFANTRSEAELKRTFSKQIEKRNNVLQDYMIVYWMRKNGNCYFREQIQENYKYYSNIMEDSVLLDQTEIKFILETGTLNDELNELNQVCK